MPFSYFPIELVQTKTYLLTALLAFVVVLMTTPTIKTIALKFNRVDQPSHRKVHHRPMVRLGGIAICLATFTALWVASKLGALQSIAPEQLSSFWIVLWGAMGFFCVGVADDLISLSPVMRLVMQASIASLVWLAGVRIDFVSLPEIGIVQLGWLSLPLTVLWLTGVVNAINWIDGLDGLASGVAAIAAATSFLICLQTGQLAAALAGVALLGSLLGFLMFNFNPAQIFMGDGGSYFIGFLLAGISIIGLVKSATVGAIVLPFIVLAVPLGDMSLVILARLRNGVSPFLADRRHLHHRLLKVGLPHRLTVLVMYALTYWVGSLALLLVGMPNGALVFGSATGLVLFVGGKAWAVAHQTEPSY